MKYQSKRINKPFKFEMHKPKINLTSLKAKETEQIMGELCGLDTLSSILEPSQSS